MFRAIIATVILLAGLVGQAAESAPLDPVIARAASLGFSGEVLVTDARHVTYARAVSAPARSHRRGEIWRWASVTKQLTATLTLQAVEQGRLTLDTPVARLLPEFQGPTGQSLTGRMLLRHQSGLPNPDDTSATDADSFPAFYLRTTGGVGGRSDALGYCAGQPKSEPGGRLSYNNCDYIVLGAILEKISGKSFAALLDENIGKPAGMTSLAIARPDTSLQVRGHMEKGQPEPPVVLATFGPAGAAIGSSDDLARFDQALLTGRLLKPSTQTLGWSGDPSLGYAALGVWSFPAKLAGCDGPVDLVERRGEIGGVEVRNLLAPKLGKALIVFADRAGLPFGEIWQGKGLTYDLASAAFCTAA